MNTNIKNALAYSQSWKWVSLCLVVLFLSLSMFGAYFWQDSSRIDHPEVLTITRAAAAQAPFPTLPNPQVTESLTWQSVGLPHNWERQWRNHNGVVWYKLTFDRTAQQLSQQVLSTQYVDSAATVFLNRKLIAQTDSNWPPVSNHWQNPMFWPIAPNTLAIGQNELLIAVYGSTQARPGIGPLRIGSRVSIAPIYQHDLFLQQYIPFITFCIAVLAGIAFLSVWFYYRKDIFLMWFGLYCLTWGCLLLNYFPYLNQLLNRYIGIYAGEAISDIARVWIYIFLFKVCLSFCGMRHPVLEKLSSGFALFCTALILFSPFDALHIQTEMIVWGGTLLMLWFIGWLFWKALQINSSTDLRIIAFSLLTVPFMLMHDGAALVDLQADRVLIQGYWCFFLLLTSSAITIWQFIRRTRQSEILNDLLDKKMRALESELDASTLQERALALNTAREEEKAQLLYEVHHGLSASINEALEQLAQDKIAPENVSAFMNKVQEELRHAVRKGTQSKSS